MTPTTVGLLVGIAVVAITVIALIPRKKIPKVEGYKDEQMSIGIGITVGLMALLFAVFFLFFYSFPKQPNVIRRIQYYNLD